MKCLIHKWAYCLTVRTEVSLILCRLPSSAPCFKAVIRLGRTGRIPGCLLLFGVAAPPFPSLLYQNRKQNIAHPDLKCNRELDNVRDAVELEQRGPLGSRPTSYLLLQTRYAYSVKVVTYIKYFPRSSEPRVLRVPRPGRQPRQVPEDDPDVRAGARQVHVHNQVEHTAVLESGTYSNGHHSMCVTLQALNDLMVLFRAPRSNTTSRSAAPTRPSATRRSTATWPSATTSGTRTGSARSAARETGATTTSR